jgi:hypothetical protein
MTTEQEIVNAVQSLRAHSAGGAAAPHKPIVLLVALGRLRAGNDRLMRFADVRETIDQALVASGRPKNAYQPFWRLLSSSPVLWEMPSQDRDGVTQTASGDATPSTLLEARAGFPERTARVLRDPEICDKVIALLAAQVPPEARARVLQIANVETPRSGASRAQITSSTPSVDVSEDEELLAFPEGEARQRFTWHRQREQRLRKAKIEEVLRVKGTLACEVPGCGFDFQETYGATGEGFAHVHHTKPLSGLRSNTLVSKADLAVVCANCHAMIHRGGVCRDLDDVRPRR